MIDKEYVTTDCICIYIYIQDPKFVVTPAADALVHNDTSPSAGTVLSSADYNIEYIFFQVWRLSW